MAKKRINGEGTVRYVASERRYEIILDEETEALMKVIPESWKITSVLL